MSNEDNRFGDEPDSMGDISAGLLGLFRKNGVSQETLRKAIESDSLHVLAVDLLLGPPGELLSVAQVAEISGIDKGVLVRLWRALGFTDPVDQQPSFHEIDVEASTAFSGLLGSNPADVEVAIQLARVIGSALARVAEAEILSSIGLREINRPERRLSNLEVAERFSNYVSQTVPTVPKLLSYVWLRHLHGASKRLLMLRQQGEGVELAQFELTVGFLDLVGFTVLSQQLETEELASLVNHFDEVSHDTVTGLGGRVVKMIGDEVMFVSEDPEAAVEIAMTLQEIYSQDREISEVRAGLAHGMVLAKDGDYYGPVVNLASRIVNIATPGSILVSDEVNKKIAEKVSIDSKALQPRFLKDLGYVQLFRLKRSPSG
ncbi:MAG: hypothetical protein HKL83_01540 [Acidimicrobiaceae bacterium]|nr:hypothetical protein [Acidimicrobiaceae bacterium]